MKISDNAVEKVADFARMYGNYVIGAAFTVAAVGAAKYVQNIGNERATAREYVMNTDPARYNNIMSSGYQDKSAIEKTFFWQQEARKLQDSLRIDSIAKEAYAKGLIAVKDSTQITK